MADALRESFRRLVAKCDQLDAENRRLTALVAKAVETGMLEDSELADVGISLPSRAEAMAENAKLKHENEVMGGVLSDIWGDGGLSDEEQALLLREVPAFNG